MREIVAVRVLWNITFLTVGFAFGFLVRVIIGMWGPPFWVNAGVLMLAMSGHILLLTWLTRWTGHGISGLCGDACQDMIEELIDAKVRAIGAGGSVRNSNGRRSSGGSNPVVDSPPL